MRTSASRVSDQRDRETERSAGRSLPDHFTLKVVGVSFVPSYPDNLLVLGEAALTADNRGEPLVAILIRNPDNQFDANAVEVHVPALGEEYAMIGHLTRPVAARLAPELDSGINWMAEVESVLINPEHLDRPGISIKCARGGEKEE